MRAIRLQRLADIAEWRDQARRLLLSGHPPDSVSWHQPDDDPGLFAEPDELPSAPPAGQPAFTVPSAFLELAQAAICHSDRGRFALLYRLLWRLQENRALLGIRSDPDVQLLEHLVSAVRRDTHKMKAFVRFRLIVDQSGSERFAAWFEPDHYIVERVAPFFARRFAGMVWAIVTPYQTASWDGAELAFGPGGRRSDVPSEDALEESWRTYFSSIFNPARLKVAQMRSEMPVKYWRNLPEAGLIPALIRDASRREGEMIRHPASEPPVRHQRMARRLAEREPEKSSEIVSLADAGAAIHDCRRCGLCEFATQPVFGEGPQTAELMFVGEQPGDQEDLAGRPFVGPAGRLFDQALDQAGIDRRRTYVTNAVKHFKFAPRGKRRLHQKPNGGEIAACRFWLDLERDFVKPRLLVALGATAVQSVLGSSHALSSLRNRPMTLDDGTCFFATIHPSYLLRIREPEAKLREERAFMADLMQIKTLMQEGHQKV